MLKRWPERAERRTGGLTAQMQDSNPSPAQPSQRAPALTLSLTHALFFGSSSSSSSMQRANADSTVQGQTADSRQQTADSRQQTADSMQTNTSVES